jgi:hypothetical protein
LKRAPIATHQLLDHLYRDIELLGQTLAQPRRAAIEAERPALIEAAACGRNGSSVVGARQPDVRQQQLLQNSGLVLILLATSLPLSKEQLESIFNGFVEWLEFKSLPPRGFLVTSIEDRDQFVAIAMEKLGLAAVSENVLLSRRLCRSRKETHND